MDRPESNHLDVAGFVALLRRRWPLILICGLVAAGLSFARSKHERPIYEASSRVLFTNDLLAAAIGGTDVSSQLEQNLPGSVMQTNLLLIDQLPVAEAVKQTLRSPSSPAQLRNQIKVTQDGLSSIAVITARAHDSKEASTLANAWASTFVRYQLQVSRQGTLDQIALVEKQLASNHNLSTLRRDVLNRRLQSLETVASVQTASVRITEQAQPPSSPASPNTKLNTILGGIVGVLIGLLIAFLLARLDRRVRTLEDVEKTFELPILGTIPDSARVVVSRDADATLPAADAEAFRILRANLRYFNVSRPIGSLLLTSVAPAEGKSTVAWNLAVASAASGARVVLVELDLRRPSIASRLGLPGEPGVGSVLTGDVSLADATQSIKVPVPGVDGSVNGAMTNVDLLAAGGRPPNPAELIESTRMRELLRELEDSYDLVLIDTPPVTVVADVVPLYSAVSGVLLVSRLGRTERDEAVKVRSYLARLGAHLLGVVANRVPGDEQSYDTYYYNRPKSMAGVLPRLLPGAGW
jgi:capsular exopolysaccharide synthesis family protein